MFRCYCSYVKNIFVSFSILFYKLCSKFFLGPRYTFYLFISDWLLSLSNMHLRSLHVFFKIFFKDFIYLFLERGEGREKERERNIDVWLPLR